MHIAKIALGNSLMRPACGVHEIQMARTQDKSSKRITSPCLARHGAQTGERFVEFTHCLNVDPFSHGTTFPTWTVSTAPLYWTGLTTIVDCYYPPTRSDCIKLIPDTATPVSNNAQLQCIPSCGIVY